MRPWALLLAAIAWSLPACDDPTSLPDPSITNSVDTVAIFAVTGTQVWQASAYAMTELRPVRLDRTTQADFAFDLRDGQAVLFPGELVGQPGTAGINPGLQRAAQPFDAIEVAVVNGYVTLDTLHAAVGDVFFVRSRIPVSCFFGLPTYGKLEVLGINPVDRTIQFRILVNRNCGYKGLQPGLPTQ